MNPANNSKILFILISSHVQKVPSDGSFSKKELEEMVNYDASVETDITSIRWTVCLLNLKILVVRISQHYTVAVSSSPKLNKVYCFVSARRCLDKLNIMPYIIFARRVPKASISADLLLHC